MPSDFVPCAYDEWEGPLPYGEGWAVFGMRALLLPDGSAGTPHGWKWVEIGPAPGGADGAQALLRELVFQGAEEN